MTTPHTKAPGFWPHGQCQHGPQVPALTPEGPAALPAMDITSHHPDRVAGPDSSSRPGLSPLDHRRVSSAPFREPH